MSSGQSRVLIVGGGITAALTSSALAKTANKGCCIQVWDKARGLGGRMTTSRSPHNDQCKVDLGAQYLTANEKYQKMHREYYKELIDSGVIVPFDIAKVDGHRPDHGSVVHYVAPEGMSSVVKHFFKASGVQTYLNRKVVEINKILEANLCKGFQVKTECGIQEDFDHVILTMPVPQILQLGGDVQHNLSQDSHLHKKLQNIEYSSRFALGLFFNERTNLGTKWASKYIKDHPVFRFVSIDNIRRGKEDSPTSVLVHTSVQYGQENVDASPESKKEELLASFKSLFPDWPQPDAVKCLKWKFSQVSQNDPDTPCALKVDVGSNKLLVLAGDAFTGAPNFNGCAESAVRAADLLACQA